MRKGISPIVAVVLLIAIAVIAAVGLYFWVGGLATKQPTPSTPGTISAVCQSGVVTVCNTGTTGIDATSLLGTVAVEDAGAEYCGNAANVDMASTDCCIYASGEASGTGTVYGASIAQAQYSC